MVLASFYHLIPLIELSYYQSRDITRAKVTRKTVEPSQMQNSWKRQREDIFLERTETLFLHRSGTERATKRLREEREGEIQNKNSSSLHSTSLSKHTDLRNFPLPPQTCGSPAPTQSHSHPKKLSPNILSFLVFKSFISSLMKFSFSFGLTPSCYLLLHC